MLSANQHPITGRDTIYQQMLANNEYILSWEPQNGEVASSGDLGYTWGKYKVTAKNPDGAATCRYGKYLNVWKKQPDGSWKVLVDMGNASPNR
ncbi:MAG: nuclear transport factor 2 family protein [Candidatus Marinimicrobia bacterium]|nr:nuclear transport factor 2 family protein [Candidatus Neomarinimicrobiota bacterium]